MLSVHFEHLASMESSEPPQLPLAETETDPELDADVDVEVEVVGETASETEPDTADQTETDPELEADVDAEVEVGSETASEAEQDDAGETALDNGDEVEPSDAPEDSGSDLSPAVRRLIRQYELDPGEIHGTGPDGRIRVGDVMALLGGRDARPAPLRDDDEAGDELVPREAPGVRPQPASEVPVTSIFECDMSAVLTHRKRMLAEKSDFLLTSYYIVAAAAALRALPEANGGQPSIDIAVALSAPGGSTATPVLEDAATLTLAGVNDTLRDAHRALGEGSLQQAGSPGTFLVYHHGVTGSILATPTPLAAEHAGSLGVGRIRRKVAVQNVSTQGGPRIAPMCYVSLTFRPSELDLHRANQFLNLFVRRLERWPPASGPAS